MSISALGPLSLSIPTFSESPIVRWYEHWGDLAGEKKLTPGYNQFCNGGPIYVAVGITYRNRLSTLCINNCIVKAYRCQRTSCDTNTSYGDKLPISSGYCRSKLWSLKSHTLLCDELFSHRNRTVGGKDYALINTYRKMKRFFLTTYWGTQHT